MANHNAKGHPVWTEDQKKVGKLKSELKRLLPFKKDPQSLLDYINDIEGQIQHMTEPCPGEAHNNPYADTCGVCMGDPAPWGRITRGVVKNEEVPTAAKSSVPGAGKTTKGKKVA